ncbi:hypothetical protein D1872_265620 [compost metagenome]
MPYFLSANIEQPHEHMLIAVCGERRQPIHIQSKIHLVHLLLKAALLVRLLLKYISVNRPHEDKARCIWSIQESAPFR